MPQFAAIPTLDELAADPGRGRKLPPAVRNKLIARAAAIVISLSAVGDEPTADEKAARPDDRLLTVQEAAELLNCTKDWVYRHAGKLPCAVRMGGQLRFSAEGLQR